MWNEVNEYVSNCETSRKSKINNEGNTEPMGEPKSTEGGAWSVIPVDFIGPLLRSKRGITVLLVQQVYVICYPMKKQYSKKYS
jgi:hypothetical protein